MFTRFEIQSQPALVLVYPDGRTERVFGAADDDLIDMLIEGALA